MSIEVVKEYDLYDYVGTFYKFSDCAEKFLNSLSDDIDFKRVNEDDGVLSLLILKKKSIR